MHNPARKQALSQLMAEIHSIRSVRMVIFEQGLQIGRYMSITILHKSVVVWMIAS